MVVRDQRHLPHHRARHRWPPAGGRRACTGGLWYFPPGLPHSLQGLGPDGTEFVIVFDDGHATEFDTLMVTDWLAHTPPEVLAKNFGVSVDNVP